MKKKSLNLHDKSWPKYTVADMHKFGITPEKLSREYRSACMKDMVTKPGFYLSDIPYVKK